MAYKKSYLIEWLAFPAMLGIMYILSFLFSSLYDFILSSQGVMGYIITLPANYPQEHMGTAMNEIKWILVNISLRKSLYVALSCGIIWWLAGYFAPPTGPGEGTNKKILWYSLIIAGCAASATFYFMPLRTYEEWIKPEYYYPLTVVPMLTSSLIYAIGTFLASPASISGSVPFFNLRKYL